MKIGQRVHVSNDCYNGDGTIVGFTFNMLGRQLILVDIDNDTKGACFYGYKVTQISPAMKVTVSAKENPDSWLGMLDPGQSVKVTYRADYYELEFAQPQNKETLLSEQREPA